MTSTGGLCRGHHVSLRRQLAVGLEAAIRDGHLERGSELPSTRDMAARTGLHRSTVAIAYARLRRRGWIEGGPGARVRVRAGRVSPPLEPAERRQYGDSEDAFVRLEAERALRRFLHEARGHGHGRDRAIEALARIVDDLVGRRGPGEETRSLFLFEPLPGLGAALAGELERRLAIRVSRCRRFPDLAAAAGRPIVVRAELVDRVVETWPNTVDPIGLSIAGGTRERGLVRRTVRSGLVTLVSVSRAIRRYAVELAAREFDRGVSFLALAPQDRAGVLRATAASRLVLFDEPSGAKIPAGRAPCMPIRLFADAEIDALGHYLSVGRMVDRPRS